MVRKERLELSHLAAPEPKSGASTNSAIPAYCLIRINPIEYISKAYCTDLRIGKNSNCTCVNHRMINDSFIQRIMVRKERLELSHLAAPEPKSGASTNSATSAYLICS
jgi:hypothetical protein